MSYWSPLSCLVNKQEETDDKGNQTSVDLVMQAIAITRPGNTVAAHWAQKLENRKAQRNGILDTGAMSSATLADDEEYLMTQGRN
jgi:hypothetical protein